MEQIFTVLNIQSDYHKTIVSFLILWTLLSVVALVLHKLLVHYFLKLANFTNHAWDDYIADNTRRPLRFLMLTFAAITAVEFSALPLKDIVWMDTALKGLTIFFMFWSIERVVFSLIKAGVLLKKVSTSSQLLISIVIRAAIFVIAFLMILDAAGISITPLLASLGVGSVAVALALQDTLSNLFSGFYILADKPFQVGDFVEIDNGAIQGYVTKVGWRSTHIKQITNNIIVVPNSKVADSTLVNYDLNEKQTSMLIPCGVAYESDLEKVEKVCIDVAKKMSDKDYYVKDFDARVRFNEFGSSSINFNVIIRVNQYENHFKLKHEYIMALHKAFGENGIEIPFPQRVMTFKTPLKHLPIEENGKSE